MPLPVKAIGLGDLFFQFPVESGEEFRGARDASDGIEDHDRGAIPDLGIVDPFEHRSHAARERLRIREAGVQVAPDDLKREVVEEVGNKPGERVVPENAAQSGGECASGAIELLGRIVLGEEQVR